MYAFVFISLATGKSTKVQIIAMEQVLLTRQTMLQLQGKCLSTYGRCQSALDLQRVMTTVQPGHTTPTPPLSEISTQGLWDLLLFVKRYIYLFIYLFIHSFIHLFIYLFILLCIYLFIYLFIYSFINYIYLLTGGMNLLVQFSC